MRAETALLVALTVVLAAALPAAALAGEASASAAAAPDGAASATVDDVTAGDATIADATAGDATIADAVAPSQATTAPDGEDRTVTMDVQLLASGDADWTVSTYVPLENEDDRAAFEELGRRYVDGTVSLDVGLETFRRAVAAARNDSGRSMALVGVERDWTVENGTGVLVLRFTWERFARQEDDEFVVDDAFRTGSGTWLPRLARGQTLIMRPPEDVGFLETPEGKGVTDGSLRWEGPQTFGDDYFRVVYRPEEGVTPTTPDGSPTSPTSPASPPDTPTDTPAGSLPGGVVVVPLLVVGAAAAYLLRRRREDDGEGAGTADDGGPDVPAGGAAGGGSDAAVADADDGGTDAEPTPGADAGADADTGGDPGAPAEPTPEDPFAGVDVEMLSDEERVLRLLEANGGRMKQARIVKETDWSNAKVSQLLSSMEDDDAIDKLRIGRENLISLPDVDIDAVEE